MVFSHGAGMSAFIVGLTGGIGSGKTTVANLFAAQGIALVDADIVAREVVAPGQPALAAIAAHFGHQILTADGQLNRPALRSRVFSDPSAKAWLDQLLHPLIRQQLLLQLQQAQSPYVLLVAPLLIENGLTAVVDQLLVVDVDPQLQLQRTVQRDQVSSQQVAAIMASQCQRAERLQLADQIISNESDVAALSNKVASMHQLYLAMAAEKLAKSPT
jgi:dephospho-CoA kinase